MQNRERKRQDEGPGLAEGLRRGEQRTEQAMEQIRGENINRVKERALRRKTRIYGFIGSRDMENLCKWEDFFRQEFPEQVELWHWWYGIDRPVGNGVRAD